MKLNRINTAGLVAGVGSLALIAALAFQHFGELAPCALCIDQRKAWGAAILLAALSMWAEGKSRIAVSLLMLGLAALAALGGALIALFHVGVEQKWWEGTAACGGAIDFSSGSIADIRDQMLAAPVVRCDEVAWSMLGISMAGWNGLIAFATGATALNVALKDYRRIRST